MNQYAPGQDWIAIVRKNGNEGLIEHIQLYHSPLPVVVEFSRELAKRLQGKVDQALINEER